MKTKSGIDTIFTMLLFGAFATSLLILLVTGARSYQDVKSVADRRFSENTGVSYVTTKVRHYDSLGGVSVGQVGGIPALLLRETIDGEPYVTYLYYNSEYLMELFILDTPENQDALFPDDGEPVIEAEDMTFEITDLGLLKISCTGTGGGTSDIELMLRSGGVSS